MSELPSLAALEWAWSQPLAHPSRGGATTWRAFCVAMVTGSIERAGLGLEALRFNGGDGDEPAKLKRVAQAPSGDAAATTRPV